MTSTPRPACLSPEGGPSGGGPKPQAVWKKVMSILLLWRGTFQAGALQNSFIARGYTGQPMPVFQFHLPCRLLDELPFWIPYDPGFPFETLLGVSQLQEKAFDPDGMISLQVSAHTPVSRQEKPCLVESLDLVPFLLGWRRKPRLIPLRGSRSVGLCACILPRQQCSETVVSCYGGANRGSHAGMLPTPCLPQGCMCPKPWAPTPVCLTQTALRSGKTMERRWRT